VFNIQKSFLTRRFTMKITAIRTLQTQLKTKGYNPGAVDGNLSTATRAAIAQALTTLNPNTETDWRTWPSSRQTVLCLQTLCLDDGLNPGALDGWWGPQTEYASGQLVYLQDKGELPEPWRDLYPVPANPNSWPLERQDVLDVFYGKPGTNLVMLELPYPLRLAWDPATVVKRTQCNAKVKESMIRVLGEVLNHYGLPRIQELRLDLYGGGFILREKRGGTNLSTHSWGIAFDFDPTHNKLQWGRDRAVFAKPEYEPWWRIWEAEGWVSLGRTKNYDWMHVQATRV